MRSFRRFTHKGATFHVACDRFGLVTHEVVRQRKLLERYIAIHPAFMKAMRPVRPKAGAPEVALRMAAAAASVGVGPMAAVAGAMAQAVVETVLAAGSREAIVDNGGDVFMKVVDPVRIGLDAGEGEVGGSLAFLVMPEETPLSICSSSGKMGHSYSRGRCDLATVVAKDGALADAAATQAGNLVRRQSDLGRALDRIMLIGGVLGVLLVMGDKVGTAGRLPKLVAGESRKPMAMR
jgi:ApbE superfamily uncharacterized protein (UPF0280 family)